MHLLGAGLGKVYSVIYIFVLDKCGQHLGTYVSWRFSVRPLGRRVRECTFCNVYICIGYMLPTFGGYMSVGGFLRVFHKKKHIFENKNASTRSASIWELLGHQDEMAGRWRMRVHLRSRLPPPCCLAALSKDLAWAYTFLSARE